MVFAPVETGQEPDLKVFAHEFSQLHALEQTALQNPQEKDSQHLIDGVRAVREYLSGR
jgi:hypothetical protein